MGYSIDTGTLYVFSSSVVALYEQLHYMTTIVQQLHIGIVTPLVFNISLVTLYKSSTSVFTP